MASNVPARSRSDGAASGRHWQKRFLDTLSATSSLERAAGNAGVSIAEAYQARRDEPDFARGWQAALADGYLGLELEVIRRLREGDAKTGDGEKFDFANAIRLLTSHRDSVGRTASQVRDVTAAEVRASIDRKIEDIRRRIAREKAAAEGKGE
ncbi:hypothetical protein [Erythrobacter oryzae]|uniref:hypothetical protein n=1 Tax=Erythrobacter oryzae TaxID=3019556 RepID=UPI0025545A12|nr:hypothetical protein [Erythrobacter sp. COR-2]